ncbi:hypothetical protein [Nocardioides litoris]|uniref:hypothetical protein n=1 Tax=Nocardioides litoris TaxID=1926648 RepID=UPI00111E582F|nr:hypothetical protein [Nocardioides litoris]
MTHLALVPPANPTPTGRATHPPSTRRSAGHQVQTYDASGTNPFRNAPLAAVRDGFHRPHGTRAGAARTRWSECPNTDHYRLNLDTGQLIKAYCKRLTCPSCIVPRAIGVGQAIALAEPSHMVTVTQLGNEWTTIHAGMRKFTARLRRLGTDAQFAYHVEPFANGLNSHAHLWWRGAAPDADTVSKATRAAGIGWHHMVSPAPDPTEHYRVPSHEYGLKLVLDDRPEDPSELWPGAQTYLAMNGNRLVHTTRGFWLDAAGSPCTLARAQSDARGHRRGQWVSVAA